MAFPFENNYPYSNLGDSYDWGSMLRNTGLVIASPLFGAASSGATLATRQAGALGQQVIEKPAVQLGGIVIVAGIGLVLWLALRDR